MAKWIWGLDPLAASRLGREEGVSPLSVTELACLGIPARKIPRVQAGLARLAGSCRLQRAALLALARQIARQLR